jgi:iron complex outermembrane recepter protein
MSHWLKFALRASIPLSFVFIATAAKAAEQFGYFSQNPEHRFDQAKTPLEAISQAKSPTLIQDLQISSQEDILKILIVTSETALELAAGSPTVSGKSLVYDIPNAALKNNQPIERLQPAPGIERIMLQPLPADPSRESRVQLVITGRQQAPDSVQLKTQEGQQGLLIGVKIPETGRIDAAAEESGDEEELVVTAQKREENPQEIPISITVFNEQAVEDSQINNIADLAARTPNFSINPSTSGRIFTFYGLRGLNNANFLSRKDVVGFYVDEVPYDYAAFINFDLVDIERIEVLRGPQSTLYGRNSQAGVVNILTRPPTNKPELRLNAGYGSFDTKNIGLSYSGALIPDKLKFRIVGNYRETDGFTRNTFLNTDAGEQQEGIVRGELLWTPTKEWEVSLKAGASFGRDGDSVYAPIDSPNPYEVQYNRDAVLENTNITQALKATYKGKNFQFASITTHRQSSQIGLNAEGDYTAQDLFSANYRFKSNVWSQELRFQSPETSDKFRWIAGAYFEANAFKVDGEGFEIVGSGLDSIFADIDTTTYALFGQIDYKPISRLTLTAGLRFESNRSTIDRSRTFTPAGTSTPLSTPDSLVVQGTQISEEVILPKVSLDYRITPNVSIYGSIARGYKPGGFNYRAESPEFLVFQPEKSWNYEIGIKSSFLNDRLSANLALFATDLQNYQVILAGPDGFFREITNAQASIKGLELEVLARPLDGLQLNASLGLLDGSFQEYRNPFTGVDFSGNRLNYAPSLTYNLGVQYRHPKGFFGRVEVQGFGTTYFDDANTLKQVPYALVNARLGYETEKFGIYFYANNLFDTQYLTGAFIFPPPNEIGSFGERATFGIQARFKF